jgi:hypothetical protein
MFGGRHWRWLVDDRILCRPHWRRGADFDPLPGARGNGDFERLGGPRGAPFVSQGPKRLGRAQELRLPLVGS